MVETREVKVRRSKRLAVALAIVPLVVAGVMYFFGADAVVLNWQGTMVRPTSVIFEVHNFGLVLVLASIVGLIWLVYLLIRGLFSNDASDQKKEG